MTITLPADLEAWVEEEARAKAYPDASALLADIIRHEQERRQALAEIQALVTEGIESGVAKVHDPIEFRSRLRTLARAKAIAID